MPASQVGHRVGHWGGCCTLGSTGLFSAVKFIIRDSLGIIKHHQWIAAVVVAVLGGGGCRDVVWVVSEVLVLFNVCSCLVG